jgi:uncharacterized protein (DUF1778 family)
MQRTTLPLRCSAEEARVIRSLARSERRSISGYVPNAVIRAVDLEERLYARLNRFQPLNQILSRRALLDPGLRTAIL